MRPPYARVGEAYKKWEEIGASPWLVRQIWFGLQLPWTGTPKFQPKARYNLETAHATFAEEEIQRWVRLQYAVPVSQIRQQELVRSGRVSPAFVSTTARKLHLLVDYSTVNDCLEDRTFRMDQLGDFAAVLHPHDALFKADITDAHYHLRLRREDRERLAFMVGEKVYLPLCLNCGLSGARGLFKGHEASRCPPSGKRTQSVQLLGRCFGAARSSTLGAATALDTEKLCTEINQLFENLGLTLHPEKCVFSGSRRLEILGILVDTERARFLLSAQKPEKVKVQARRLLRYAASHLRYIRITDIRKFAGLAKNSVSPALVDARLCLRELFNSFGQHYECHRGTCYRGTTRTITQPHEHLPTSMTNLTSCVTYHASQRGAQATIQSDFAILSPRRLPHVRRSTRVSHAAMQDLQWWARQSGTAHVGRDLWPKQNAVAYTDASMSGWGAAWNGIVPAAGFFDERHKGAHINELEVLATLYALRYFVQHARERTVQIVTDSKVIEFVVRNMTSQSPRILAHLRALRNLCEMEGATLSTRHIPSVLNSWADRLSCRKDSHEWELPPVATCLMERRIGRSLSLVNGHELPGFIPSYREPVFLPRPALLPVWSRYLQRRRGGVIISPNWRGRGWF